MPIGVLATAREDAHGLYTETQLFTSEAGEAVREAVRVAALTGMSFSFRVTEDTWEDSNERTV
jgi:HK97 family phage prohead protease